MSKQAKIFGKDDLERIQFAIEHHIRPDNRLRMKVMVGLSCYAGLRACEIAAVTLQMISDPDGEIGDFLELTKYAVKGKKKGRIIGLHPTLKTDIENYLRDSRRPCSDDFQQLLISGTGNPFSANMVTVYLFNLYKRAGLSGCSSHSGRRSFVTKLARDLVQSGGSLRDIQELVGHASLITTQKYIEGSSEAKIKLINRLKY
jgi:site-specific recombinase XerD